MKTGLRAVGMMLTVSTLAPLTAGAAEKKSCQDWVAALKATRTATLEQIGPADKAAKTPWCAEMVPLFVQALDDADGTTRFRAALSLERLAASSPARAADLRPHLDRIVAAKERSKSYESPSVAMALQEAIGHVGAPAVPHLMKDLKDWSDHFAHTAAVVLGQIGPPAAAALPALEAGLKETTDTYAREQLEKAIRSIRGK